MAKNEILPDEFIEEEILKVLNERPMTPSQIYRRMSGAGWLKFRKVLESMNRKTVRIREVGGKEWVSKR